MLAISVSKTKISEVSFLIDIRNEKSKEKKKKIFLTKRNGDFCIKSQVK